MTGLIPIKIGILGGGQLGRMLQEAAHRLNLSLTFLDSPNSPAKQLSNSSHITGHFADPAKIKELAQNVDVITFEIEHVDVGVLEGLESDGKVQVCPNVKTIKVIQDKYEQKKYLSGHNIPLAQYKEVKSLEDLKSLCRDEKDGGFGIPLMLKAKKLAYDGRGNYLIKSSSDSAISEAWQTLNPTGNVELYVEKFVPFVKEVAVMVVRSINGDVVSYPVVETVHKRSICSVVYAPAQIDGVVRTKAQEVAEKAVKCLHGAGIFGVEMFVLPDDSILLNEMAPRPHNSGHYTIEACHTSQFENHLRAITGLPLGSTALKVPYAVMYNILGASDTDENLIETLKPVKKSLTVQGATVHMYGKSGVKKDRKLGHITIVADSYIELTSRLSAIMSQSPDAFDRTLAAPSPSPLVSIIMGSDSDLPVMKAAAQFLSDFDVPFELTIVSAHRTPLRMVEFAKSAHKRGIKVIIAAAGGAAHLPGMVAALTPLPVIGVPVALKVLDGMDSLYSIVQMPRGVPVATVAINNSTNAALLAVRMLGSHYSVYLEKMIDYQDKVEGEVMRKVDNLEKTGWEEYKI
ncbi:hypothetical protein BKA69DRAFT_1030329 [Paraphysoderma sedebokerense]|nr:hypothetical protein BKA69DRAFT_1030329 [Paraphysoderma sedebokerense]